MSICQCSKKYDILTLDATLWSAINLACIAAALCHGSCFEPEEGIRITWGGFSLAAWAFLRPSWNWTFNLASSTDSLSCSVGRQLKAVSHALMHLVQEESALMNMMNECFCQWVGQWSKHTCVAVPSLAQAFAYLGSRSVAYVHVKIINIRI